MENRYILKSLDEIQSEAEYLSRLISRLKHMDISKYPEEYDRITYELACRSERNTCRLRHLIYTTTGMKKRDYLADAAEVHGIEIKYEDGIFEVKLPCLIPKKNKVKGREFIVDPLFFSLSRYAYEHKIPKYEQCVVCFSHVYKMGDPLSKVKDYDNYESKPILDAIATFVMSDDAGYLCDSMHVTKFGDGEYTRITVIDKAHFTEWLRENWHK